MPTGTNLGVAYAFDNNFSKLNGRLSLRPGEGLTVSSTRTSPGECTWVPGSTSVHRGRRRRPCQSYQWTARPPGGRLFARLAFADKDTNLAKFSTSVGLGGRGIIPSRDNDTFGIGYFYINLQKTRLGGILGLESSSQGFETFYNLAITPASGLTFDLQVLDSPNPANDTTVILGTRLNLRF